MMQIRGAWFKFGWVSCRLIEILIAVICLLAVSSVFAYRIQDGLGSVLSALLVASAGVLFMLILRRISPRPIATRTALLIIFAIGLGTRLLSIILIPNRQVSDFDRAHELAVSVSEGKGLTYTRDATLRYFSDVYNTPQKSTWTTAAIPPGTPMLLGAVYAMAGKRPAYGKILYVILGALTGALLYLLLAPAGHSRAWWCGVLWAIYPTAIFSSNLLCTEVPTACFMVGSLCLMNAVQKASGALWWVAAVIAGVCSGMVTLFRPATHFIISGAVAGMISLPRSRKNLLFAGIFLLCASIPLVCWGLRNYHVFGRFAVQPTEIGGSFVVATGYLADSTGEKDDADAIAFRNSHDEFENSERGIILGRKRIVNALRKPGFMLLMVKNQYTFWRTDREMLSWVFEGQQDPGKRTVTKDILYGVVEASFLWLLFFALIGVIRIRRLAIEDNAGLAAMMLFVVGTVILTAVFRADPRYHFMLMPLMCALAGNGMSQDANRQDSVVHNA